MKWLAAGAALIASLLGALIGWFIGGLLPAVLAMALMASPAIADEFLPRGLGHSSPDMPHWYEGGCCNRQDCEPVEAGAITQAPQGYHVRYLTSRGFIADGVIPYDSSGIRPSRDARDHACATRGGFIPCIYLPMTM